MTNWNTFAFALRYEASHLRDDLINIEAHRLALNRLHLPQEWRSDLQRLYIVRAVHGTTAIEGNPLTEQEVSLQLSAQKQSRIKDQVHRQTENAAGAFRWVEENFKEQRSLRLEDLLTVHEILTAGSDEHHNTPGRLRQSGHNVTVGSPQLGGVHLAPPGGETTRKLVTRFLEFVNSGEFRAQPVVIQALVAHFYFVTLHPFGDGNGRATRCLEAAMLYGGGYNTYGFYSLSNYFYRNRDDYFRTLQAVRTEHRYDLTAFLRFGAKGFREELERINTYVRNRTHRLHYRELIRRCAAQRVGKRRRMLNDREVQMLHAILDAGRPSDPFSDDPGKEAKWADLMPVVRPLYGKKSPRTIIRELDRLEKLGFIRIQQQGGDISEWDFLIRFDAIERY